jgi:hypothetical protein
VSGSIYCHRLTEALRRRLREAGFTGTVTASNGVVYYYQDGRRVKNPYAKGGDGKGTSPLHHRPEEARRLAAKAKETLKYVYDNPEKLTADHLHELPKLLASLPKDNLIAFAASLGLKTGPSSQTKDKYVAALAELFPVPAHLQAVPEADEPAPVADTPPVDPAVGPQGVDKASEPQGAKPAESREPHMMTRSEYAKSVPRPTLLPPPKRPFTGYIDGNRKKGQKPLSPEQNAEYQQKLEEYNKNKEEYNKYYDELVNRFIDHKRLVTEAIAAGKTVPSKVLWDYPDLAASARTEETREPHTMTQLEYAQFIPEPIEIQTPVVRSAGRYGFTRWYPRTPEEKVKYERLMNARLESVDARRRYANESETRLRDHKRLVAEAIAAGKEVPPEVLEDYPDLAAIVRSKGDREGQ